MLPLKNHSGQYILSLDNLDISLLSQYIQKPNDQKRLLWTKPYLDGEASYQQVEIVTEDFHGEDTEADDSETYFCYICNVSVPQTYHEEHTKSKKHQTCKKLAAKFLENVAKEMNTNVNKFKNNTQNDVYYCETCSKVVSLIQKRQHDKSDYHLKCIENDKLINSILKMYDENDTVSEENSYDSRSEPDEFSSTEYLAESKNIKRITNEVMDRFVKYKPKNESFISESLFRDVLDTSEDIISLLKEIVGECNYKFMWPFMQDNKVTVVAPNGSREQIPISKYFGYTDIFTAIHCTLCRTHVTSGDLIQHIATELHLRNILQPIDNNFTREVCFATLVERNEYIRTALLLLNFEPIGSNNNSTRKVTHTDLANGVRQCLLCGEIILNVSEHVTKRHPKIKQTIPLNTNKNVIKPLTKYCEVCDRNIGLDNFTDHTKSKSHKKKVNKSVKKTETNITQAKSKTYCDICSIYIDTHNFLAHTKGGIHKNKMKTNAPSVSNAKNNSNAVVISLLPQNTTSLTFCAVCNVRVPNGGMEIHIKGKPHKKNLVKK